MSIPISMTAAGAQPTPPDVLNSTLIATVTASMPGFTPNLPGSPVEDLLSTGTGALISIDQARVDLINSLTPYGANEFLLNQLAQVYGVTQAVASNASVEVTFTTPTTGGTSAIDYVIPSGFTVSDGTNEYAVVVGGIIPSGGSITLFCVATSYFTTTPAGAGTVTSITTSIPTPYAITCTNPAAVTPATSAPTTDAWRTQVINAGLVQATGFANMLTTLLENIGVPNYLITIAQSSGNWKIIVGGNADQYQIAYAIYYALGPMINWLVGSSTTARNKIISVIDGSNTYNVKYIASSAQNVTMALTWNTIGVNAVAGNAVQKLVANALINYINTLPIGAPINTLAMQELFVSSIASIVPSTQIDRLIFVVSINGVVTAPATGTQAIYGDPELYFTTTTTGITVTQG